MIILAAEAFKTDNLFNIHIVYIHVLEWLMEFELKQGNFLLEHLSPLVWFIASGINGGPLNFSHSLSHNTKQQIVYHTFSFLEFIESFFGIQNLALFFEDKLVNHRKLYNDFKEWYDKKTGILNEKNKKDEKIETREMIKNESENCEKIDFKAKLEEITEIHQETKKNLEEVNKEYLTQVTLNYQLKQQLEAKAKNDKKTEKNEEILTPSPKPAEIKRTPSFKPCTTFEEILKTKEEALTTNELLSPEKITIFEAEILDQPTIPFYLQQSEIPNFSFLLLTSGSPSEISAHLIKVYSSIPQTHKKPFIDFLISILSQEDIFKGLSFDMLKSLIFASLQFFIMEKQTSKTEDLDLTQSHQKLVGMLMESENITKVVLILLQSIQSLLPLTFYIGLPEPSKVYLRLLLKCTLKVVNSLQVSQKNIRVFDSLLELYKLFEKHPPEELNSDCADIADYEHMFKVLRVVSDGLISLQPEKASIFYKFIIKCNPNKTVFLKYLSGILAKKYNIN